MTTDMATARIDVHHHLLYGLDDGSADLETSLKMAEIAIQDGITHVVCTPHANSEYTFSPQTNVERRDELQRLLGDRLTLGLGCDFHLSYDNIQDALAHPTRYTINAKQYLLVEFPDFGIPQNIGSSFHEMRVAGIVPILTHPERNLTLMKQPEKMAEWLRLGCMVQVTAGSVLGRFGKGPQRIAQHLLDMQWVHLLATDAHNTTSRPPILSAAYDSVANHYGAEEADRLCCKNPRAIFYGEDLGEQPIPEKIYEDMEEPKKRGLFSLFGRR